MPSPWHTPEDPRELGSPVIVVPCDGCGRDVRIIEEDDHEDVPVLCTACQQEARSTERRPSHADTRNGRERDGHRRADRMHHDTRRMPPLSDHAALDLLVTQGLARGMGAMRATSGLTISTRAGYDVLAVALIRLFEQLPAGTTPTCAIAALERRAVTMDQYARVTTSNSVHGESGVIA